MNTLVRISLFGFLCVLSLSVGRPAHALLVTADSPFFVTFHGLNPSSCNSSCGGTLQSQIEFSSVVRDGTLSWTVYNGASNAVDMTQYAMSNTGAGFGLGSGIALSSNPFPSGVGSVGITVNGAGALDLYSVRLQFSPTTGTDNPAQTISFPHAYGSQSVPVPDMLWISAFGLVAAGLLGWRRVRP